MLLSKLLLDKGSTSETSTGEKNREINHLDKLRNCTLHCSSRYFDLFDTHFKISQDLNGSSYNLLKSINIKTHKSNPVTAAFFNHCWILSEQPIEAC